jgi:hypothetical protein
MAAVAARRAADIVAVHTAVVAVHTVAEAAGTASRVVAAGIVGTDLTVRMAVGLVFLLP